MCDILRAWIALICGALKMASMVIFMVLRRFGRPRFAFSSPAVVFCTAPRVADAAARAALVVAAFV